MKRKIECVFDCAYLSALFLIAFLTLFQNRPGAGLLGSMALLLGAGDVFHLLPRMASLPSHQKSAAALGIGKWITSITTALYYVLLLEVWRIVNGQTVPVVVRMVLWGLAVLRIALCCLPQNRWTTNSASRRWGMLRNIPFVLMGILLIIFPAMAGQGVYFLHLPLAVALSFAFYLPVVLLAERFPAVGMLMIPKTLCYLWIQIMGLQAVMA